MTRTSMSAEEFAREFLGPAKEAPIERILAGKRAIAGGHDWERELDTTHAWYASEQLALMEKLPVATAPLSPSWLALAHRKKAGMCRMLSKRSRFDFYGVLGQRSGHPGRAIAMEAKNTSEEAGTLRIVDGSGGGLQLHQLKACVQAWRFGTVPAVVWRNGPHLLLVYGPRHLSEVLNLFERAGSASLKAAAGIRFHTQLVRAGPVHNWLEPLLSELKGQG